MFAFCSVERGRKSEKKRWGREGGEEDDSRSSIARIVEKGEVAKRHAARNSFLDKVAAGSL